MVAEKDRDRHSLYDKFGRAIIDSQIKVDSVEGLDSLS